MSNPGKKPHERIGEIAFMAEFLSEVGACDRPTASFLKFVSLSLHAIARDMDGGEDGDV